MNRPSMRKAIVGFEAAVFVLLAVSCQPELENSSLPDDHQELALQLYWHFERDEAVTATVAGLLEEAIESTNGLHRGASGSLYQFGSSEGGARYLLLTYLADSLEAAEAEAVLLVLHEQSSSVSEPLAVGRWTLGGFGPVDIVDHDDDGLPDVALCLWPDDETLDGEARVWGFTGGSWYTISRPSRELPACRAEPDGT